MSNAEHLINSYLEGKDNPGKQDGTGPAKGSLQRSKSKKGKRGGPTPGCSDGTKIPSQYASKQGMNEASSLSAMKALAKKHGCHPPRPSKKTGQYFFMFKDKKDLSALIKDAKDLGSFSAPQKTGGGHWTAGLTLKVDAPSTDKLKKIATDVLGSKAASLQKYLDKGNPYELADEIARVAEKSVGGFNIEHLWDLVDKKEKTGNDDAKFAVMVKLLSSSANWKKFVGAAAFESVADDARSLVDAYLTESEVPAVKLVARKYGMDAGQLNRALLSAHPMSALSVMGVIKDLYGSYMASQISKRHLDAMASYFTDRG